MDRETAEEIKRHFGVVADGLRYEIRIVAEGLTAFREESRRDHEALGQEMRSEFGEVKAMIRFSHAELDRRVRGLEAEMADVRARLEKVEARTS